MKIRFSDLLSDFLFEYETPRQVLVKNKRVGVVCRLIQLGVLVYIIGWVFIYEKGYQSTDTAISSIMTKMKGIGVTNENGTARIWDVADYVFPAQGASSFVVMTNYIMTEGQQQGTCPEPQANCTSDTDCKGGTFKRTGHGQLTGKCLTGVRKCEIQAWCPTENEPKTPDPALLMSSENFTLYIKNSIAFPEFKVSRSNLVEDVNITYLTSCIYDPKNNPLCPIFRLGDIVKLSGFQYADIAKEGGGIGIVIDWKCDLDFPVRYCKPDYSFYALYGDAQKTDSTQSSLGYNFRYAKYYMENGTEKRTLIKVFGIQIDILVWGEARKFDIIPTLTAIGSGVGIFGVATVVCDLVLLYVLPKRDLYKNMKFKHTEIQEKKPASNLDDGNTANEGAGLH
ncbi:P2X purinoceptor 1 isoform X1 [Paramormyrops kingsleyae]|uniref:P2X purinoceptor n=1 Tax=Paramormyrops kingsleyae TaxID=1676925 RepID=A0A3B3TB82_9TELE|nr:P2X purinoceptor 1 isoform X1 [Paramormyrops kingsleyae]